MKDIAKWVIARGREPSTYAGLAALLLAFNVPYADSWAHVISTLAIGFFGVVAMTMQETRILD
jgi:hypothetical protein